MKQINHAEMGRLLRLHYNVKEPINVYGAFGIGKSGVVKQTSQEIAKEKKREFIEWRKLTRDQKIEFIESEEQRRKHFVLIELRGTQLGDGSDLRGIINLIKKDVRSYVEWDAPMAIYYMTLPYTDGILFLDERNLSIPIVQSSFYSVLYDRCIGDITFTDDWGIVSAGNRDGVDRANTFQTPAPLKDRESEFELQPPTSDDVVEFMIGA